MNRGCQLTAMKLIQEPAMDTLRASLIQQLDAYRNNEDDFIRHVDQWAREHGSGIYSALMNVFTQLDYPPEEAETIWEKLVAHRESMMQSMNRPVNLTTAICDYMLTVQKSLIHPKIVEMNLFEETHHYSKCDSLTGLYNRSFFEEALASEASRALRYQTEFSILFLDVDHFKKINDAYGHLAGDLVLKTIAKLIQSEKRAEDVSARFGGEEIVLILPGTQKTSALMIAERIRRKIQDLEIYYRRQKIYTTVSGGVATFPLDTDRVTELVDCADRALYRAKHQGRNQIVLFSSDKRHDCRMGIIGPIKVQELGMRPGQQPSLARLKDISLSGVLFESKQSIPLGSRIQVEVPLSTRETPLVLVGKVTRLQAEENYYDIGATFLHFGDQDRKAMTRHFSSLFHASHAVI